MRAFETPEIKILAFHVADVITTSSVEIDHDNGYIDFGDLFGLRK